MVGKIFDALMMRPIGWVAYFSLTIGFGTLLFAVFDTDAAGLYLALGWVLGLVLGAVIGFVLGARRMRAFMLRNASSDAGSLLSEASRNTLESPRRRVLPGS